MLSFCTNINMNFCLFIFMFCYVLYGIITVNFVFINEKTRGAVLSKISKDSDQKDNFLENSLEWILSAYCALSNSKVWKNP